VAIGIATFVTAAISMVVMLRAQRQQPALVTIAKRPDTLTLAADAALARVKLTEAESSLAVIRAEAAAMATAPTPDTTIGADPAKRDSILAEVRRLETLLRRAEQAPLLASYKSLADAPEMRSDRRVLALLDTLADIEREREGFGATGGVDPVFVALTSRASEVGRAIQAIGRERRLELLAQVPPQSPVTPEVVRATPPDSSATLATRDSIRNLAQSRETELNSLRQKALAMDQAEKVARERANAVAPPLALLASAFVLSWAFGFAVAFVGEIRTPRVSSDYELERFLGVRVLSSVETLPPSSDRGRREADRTAPPYFDPNTEGYQLAYLGLALDQPTLLVATVTGDDPVISAVVTCNLAAVAADEARNTLVIDLEPSNSTSAVLRARRQPGVVDILRSSIGWPDATTAARIGRHKTVDLVPFGGAGKAIVTADLQALLKRDCARLARYYDAIFVHAGASDVAKGLSGALPSPEIVYCAQPGVTPLRPLRAQLELIRASGGSLRGIVLWETERPVLPAAKVVPAKTVTRGEAQPKDAEAAEAHSIAGA
jgi:Mrp family chromosome partitioning ATPase